MTKPLHLHFWTNGDPTVGNYGDSAEVIIPFASDDPATIAFTKQTLKDAFKEIWDNRIIHCMTDDEIDKVGE